MRKYGEVLDYRTKDKAVVGKMYVFGDSLRFISEHPDNYMKTELIKLEGESDLPFIAKDKVGYQTPYQFCREVIEEEVRMTNRQLSEWLSKRNGEWAWTEKSSSVFTHWNYPKKDENMTVPNDVTIRSWDSDEWVVPTVEIYERDCKGVNT